MFISNSESKVKKIAESLEKEQEKTGTKLKDEVHKNYTKFIGSSRAIAALEGDMLRLRSVLNTLEDVLVVEPVATKEATKDTFAKLRHSSSGDSYLDLETHRQNVLQILEACDNLEVLTSSREFPEVIETLGKLEELFQVPHYATISSAVKPRVQKFRASLGAKLLEELENPLVPSHVAISIIDVLKALGYTERSAEIFLESKSNAIRTAIRQLKFRGDIVLYIEELSRVIFESISVVSEYFVETFPEKSLTSRLISWASEEVQLFARIFCRQVLSSDDFSAIREALQIAHRDCRSLETSGMSLKFVFDKALQPSLSAVLKVHIGRIEFAVTNRMQEDDWTLSTFQLSSFFGSFTKLDDTIKLESMKLSESGRQLLVSLDSLVAVCRAFASMDVFAVLVSSLQNLLERFVKKAVKYVTPVLKDHQVFGCFATTYFVTGIAARVVIAELASIFHRPFAELERHRRSLCDSLEDVRSQWAKRRAASLLRSDLNLTCSKYQESLVRNVVGPTQKVHRFVVFMDDFGQAIGDSMSAEIRKRTVGAICLEISNLLDSDVLPIYSGEFNPTAAGVQQFVLDMEFMRTVFVSMSTKNRFSNAIARFKAAAEEYLGHSVEVWPPSMLQDRVNAAVNVVREARSLENL